MAARAREKGWSEDLDGRLEQGKEAEVWVERERACKQEAAMVLEQTLGRQSVVLEEIDQRLPTEHAQQSVRTFAIGVSNVCGGESGRLGSGRRTVSTK